jgi:hypothetical protein
LTEFFIRYAAGLKILCRFREYYFGRTLLLNHAAAIRSGRSCPISLDRFSSRDSVRSTFVLDKIAFKTDSITEYVATTGDFVNPVTRVPMKREDVHRLQRQSRTRLVDMFDQRSEMGKQRQDDANMSQYLENEMSQTMENIIGISDLPYRIFCDFKDDEELRFEEIFQDMLKMDRSRTLAAVKSLKDVINGDPRRPRDFRSRKVFLHLVTFVTGYELRALSAGFFDGDSIFT